MAATDRVDPAAARRTAMRATRHYLPLICSPDTATDLQNRCADDLAGPTKPRGEGSRGLNQQRRLATSGVTARPAMGRERWRHQGQRKVLVVGAALQLARGRLPFPVGNVKERRRLSTGRSGPSRRGQASQLVKNQGVKAAWRKADGASMKRHLSWTRTSPRASAADA